MKVLALAALATSLFGQPVVRPKILGLAHVAYYVRDLDKARAFYEDFLGFAELPFTLKKPDGSERIAFIKINETQYLELFAEAPKDDGMLNHIAVYTDDADRMRAYLTLKSIRIFTTSERGVTINVRQTRVCQVASPTKR